MGFFSKVFNKNKKEEIVARNPFNLQINDIVDYDLVEYQVIGKVKYNEEGYIWYDYHLFDSKEHLWLYAEDDDEVRLGLFRKLDVDHQLYAKFQEEIPSVIKYEDMDYSLIEEGSANIEIEGKVGAKDGQRIKYWDYETGNGNQLSVEKWGNELEISVGEVVQEGLLEFYPAK
ncbi:DUF4178 domain-containing protein [Iocasia frigidifontis]|uniref:DUF4178 domain-containing protein n=1 Tax=Iocasia fonsfrigidae TaxID=2682810 RepID=A0A8A7KP35_9FIRM|nr:DUF4178 domain-containing protein [Iocasia fonsfrigidae]QTL99814.1 DUF4178 domain-containing protein [Iocasia fonsfrigidae]